MITNKTDNIMLSYGTAMMREIAHAMIIRRNKIEEQKKIIARYNASSLEEARLAIKKERLTLENDEERHLKELELINTRREQGKRKAIIMSNNTYDILLRNSEKYYITKQKQLARDYKALDR